MLRSLKAIVAYLQGDIDVLEVHPWLRVIAEAEEQIVNLERVESLEQLRGEQPVLRYVERSLHLLEELPLSYWIKELVEEVLVWSETAKGGTFRERKVWQEEGINCFVHNVGSAQLYRRYLGSLSTAREILVHRLIETHGWIGQQIRGEVPPSVNQPLAQLTQDELLTAEEMERLLVALNYCVIGAVSPELWAKVRQEVEELIAVICSGELRGDLPIQERVRRMRSGPISRGENFPQEWRRLEDDGFASDLLGSLEHVTFWYVEAALQTFSLEQFAKIMLLAAEAVEEDSLRHISFEPVMQSMYYDYKGQKRINVYKKRIIENYLSGLTWSELTNGKAVFGNPHLSHRLQRRGHLPDTVFFEFSFSPAAEKLIEFCIEAEKSPLYERAVLMLFDLFELRRDAFDRFHNEDDYLRQMNGTADYKAVILEHVTGRTVLDIGPGGGVLLDLLEECIPDVIPVGIDISSNVIEALQRKKQLEGRRWEVRQGDALNLKEYVVAGSIDTVIFSSILHELYSYVPLNGKKFNHETVAAALRSAFEVLSTGGVIIIRDGIMSEPVTDMRRVRFLEADGMMWLERYAKDFQGRMIRYEQLSEQEALLSVNDAMEFLYTYTWGPEAYVHEVQEQFGYFTPSAYSAFIEDTLGESAHLEVFRHYLQEGYTEALQGRVEVCDENGRSVPLPDSTCFIVIRKSEVTPQNDAYVS
ncbi:methyltransferase [Bacillus sp. FJAT-27264]|uniref:class I SAM-dependent methyltransferase n=1 Tax=Paenibacillus sp. (strain DSM 101736 / FJAT-27264) TaxID=1850362 RepID=UPI0008081813|nr:class I SAM-dependent methyltransferase [Bacillus sp. FJAT-27264]OBZ09092.1 methyltransferase [Bacillus sp. FJAT-27264]